MTTVARPRPRRGRARQRRHRGLRARAVQRRAELLPRQRRRRRRHGASPTCCAARSTSRAPRRRRCSSRRPWVRTRRQAFAHLSILVDEQRKKLSKRKHSVAVADFRARGILPEAMVNYLALLGWGPPDGVEVRPLAEIVELFRLEDVTPSPAFFDVKKLEPSTASTSAALPVDEFVGRGPSPTSSTRARREPCVRVLGAEIADRVRTLGRGRADGRLPAGSTSPSVDEAAWQKAIAKDDAGAGRCSTPRSTSGRRAPWDADAAEGGDGAGRPRRRLRQRRGRSAAGEGAGAGAGGADRSHRRPAAVRVRRRPRPRRGPSPGSGRRGRTGD